MEFSTEGIFEDQIGQAEHIVNAPPTFGEITGITQSGQVRAAERAVANGVLARVDALENMAGVPHGTYDLSDVERRALGDWTKGWYEIGKYVIPGLETSVKESDLANGVLAGMEQLDRIALQDPARNRPRSRG